MKRNLLLTVIIALLLTAKFYPQKINQEIDDLLTKYNEYGLFNGTALAAK